MNALKDRRVCAAAAVAACVLGLAVAGPARGETPRWAFLEEPALLEEPAFADLGALAIPEIDAGDAMPTEAEIEAAFDPRVANPKARMQCVPYAREASGVELRGNANTWWAQAQGVWKTAAVPIVGSVMVMRGYNTADRGHVAVVRQVVTPRKIIIDHANWLNRGEVTVNVPVWDVSEKGDWSQVRVWHVPGAHWGKRIYGAQGFILPQRLDAAAEAPPTS